MQQSADSLTRAMHGWLSWLPRWPGIIAVLLLLLALALLAALLGFYAASPAPPRGDGWFLFETFAGLSLRHLMTGGAPLDIMHPVLHGTSRLVSGVALAWILIAGTLAVFRRPVGARLASSLPGHVLVWGTGKAALDALVSNRESATPTLALLPRLDPALQDALDHHAIPWLPVDREESAVSRTLARSGSTVLVTDDSDTANIGFLERLAPRLGASPPAGGTSLIVRISDGRLRGQLSGRLMARQGLGKLRMVLYSDHDLRARFAARLTPAYHFCHGSQPETAHLVIVGRGYPAESMLVQLLKTMQFPRDRKLRFSVANEAAPTIEADFQSRFPQLATHYRVAFHQLDTSNGADWAGWLLNQAQAGKRPTGWFFVSDDPAAELKMALAVEEAYAMTGEITPPLVLLSTAGRGAGAGLLSDQPMLKLVGDVTRVENGELVSQQRMDAMATAIQQSYLEKCLAAGEAMGDRPTLVEWPQLAEKFKDENRDQAEHNWVKLMLLGQSATQGKPNPRLDISREQLEILSIAEHDRWLASRRSRNWIYAGERDDERRRHPDMIPWETLPEPRREIDRDMVRNLARLVERMGLSLHERLYCLVEAPEAMDDARRSAALRDIKADLEHHHGGQVPVIVGQPDDPWVAGWLDAMPQSEFVAVIDESCASPWLAHARAVLAAPGAVTPEVLRRMIPDLDQDWLVFHADADGSVRRKSARFRAALPEVDE